MCIFCKIIAGEIPSQKVFENEDFILIKDINPQATVHLLAIPKQHYADITQLDGDKAATLGRTIKKLGELAGELGLDKGFRISCNKGEYGCQSVSHLHLHVLGGQQLSEKMC